MSETLQKLNQFDLDLTTRIRLKSTGGVVWILAAILAHSGDSWLWATGVGLVWLLRLGGPFGHRFSALLEISIVFQALTVYVLKAIIRRERPSGEWGGMYRLMDPHSFPSGHATRAIMLAVLGQGLGPGWFGWLLTVWVPLVCIARVMTGVHYLSDILGGLILGLLMGLVMIALNPLWMQLFPYLFR